MKQSLLVILMLFIGAICNAQEAALHLGSDVWPPFTNEEDKTSLALDIVREALSRGAVSVKTSILKFNDVLSEINQGSLDGSGAIWKTTEREASLLYSEPYLENRLILIGLKETEVNIQDISDLDGQKIGLVANYAYGDQLLKAENINIVYGTSDQENLEKLFDRKIDLMLVDEILIKYLLKYQFNEAQTYLNIADTPFTTQKLYLAIKKEILKAEDIISDFNANIKEMMLDGTYNKILNLDVLELDVNGDGVMELVFNANATEDDTSETSYSIFYYDPSDKKRTQYYLNGKSYPSRSLVKKKMNEISTLNVDQTNYDTGLRIKMN
jgi:polar amino acid transport system substrate-binding protein